MCLHAAGAGAPLFSCPPSRKLTCPSVLGTGLLLLLIPCQSLCLSTSAPRRSWPLHYFTCPLSCLHTRYGILFLRVRLLPQSFTRCAWASAHAGGAGAASRLVPNPDPTCSGLQITHLTLPCLQRLCLSTGARWRSWSCPRRPSSRCWWRTSTGTASTTSCWSPARECTDTCR